MDDKVEPFQVLSYCAMLCAKATLLSKIICSKNCSGISGKTQILYVIVFATRYLDLASTYYTYSLGISLSKIALLLMAWSLALSIYFFFYETYESKYDKFKLELLLFPSMVLAFLENYGTNVNDIFWAFSVYLEAMAIIPQLYFVAQTGQIDKTVYSYVTLLTIYKTFHVMNEMYDHFYLISDFDRISLAIGIIQLMLYCELLTREIRVNDQAYEQQIEQEQQEPDINPKEAEAIRSSAISAAALSHFDDNLREIVLSPGGFQPDTFKPAYTQPTVEQTERKPVAFSIPAQM